LEPRKLIDWLKNWCPRDTLLKRPSSRKLSPNENIFGNLSRRHPLSIVLMILTLTAGLGGLLIPDTFMPARVKILAQTQTFTFYYLFSSLHFYSYIHSLIITVSRISRISHKRNRSDVKDATHQLNSGKVTAFTHAI